MEFDITHLDKKALIQALFIYSEPLHVGKAEYDIRNKRGENVMGLTEEECELALKEFNASDLGSIRIFDYCKGKPIKLIFEKMTNGRVLVESDHYDVQNGKYRFLEVLLDTFLIEDIYITKKGYRQFILNDLPNELKRPADLEQVFKSILKNTIEKRNEYGKYWTIVEGIIDYNPLFARKLVEK